MLFAAMEAGGTVAAAADGTPGIGPDAGAEG
jgi:hypothetical protein